MCHVYRGDCREVLERHALPVPSLIITDPPYESIERHRAVGTATRLKESNASNNPWWNSYFKNEEYHALFLQLFALCAKDAHAYIFCDSETEIVLLTGVNPYVCKDPCLPVTAAGWHAWPTLDWVKSRYALRTPEAEQLAQRLKTAAHTQVGIETAIVEVQQGLCTRGMGYHWARSSERIVFLEKGKKALRDQGIATFFGPAVRDKKRPALKPTGVIRQLIRASSEPGDWVLDPFCGSGVVGRVAIEEGRNAVLIDVDTSRVEVPGAVLHA